MHGHETLTPSGLIVIFLVAAILAVMAMRRLGFSAIIGYLLAGVAIGPSGFGVFDQPETLAGIAEIGVVMFLFVIGLELKLDRLIAMRRDIALLGLAQMTVTAVPIALLLALAVGLTWSAATVIAIALSLSATAIALQLLEEKGELQAVHGQKTFSVLVCQDLMIVPVLAVVPLLSSGGSNGGAIETLRAVAVGAAALGLIVVAGRYLLNPLFRLLARLGAREVMTATALLVVLGAAELMRLAGMSMALGAFLAGILLAESSFRHELEADIEPFRGLLLGLFFMSIGMLIELTFLAVNWLPLVGATIGLIVWKFAAAFAVARLDKADLRAALRAGSVLTPAGEFAFVVIPLAGSVGVLADGWETFFLALAALSMLAGPLFHQAIDLVIERRERAESAAGEEPEEDFAGARGAVLVIGAGRFGQVVNQMMLAARADVTVIDNDVEMIQAAARFGFKVYFGDGARLDVLRAAGAGNAKVICVCVDARDTATRIAEIVKTNFPLARLHVRAYDRRHVIDLMKVGVDGVVRETFESALAFGRLTLDPLGLTDDLARDVENDIRRRDGERLAMQIADGQITAGMHLTYKSGVVPEPLTKPTKKTKALSAETEQAIADPPPPSAASPAN